MPTGTRRKAVGSVEGGTGNVSESDTKSPASTTDQQQGTGRSSRSRGGNNSKPSASKDDVVQPASSSVEAKQRGRPKKNQAQVADETATEDVGEGLRTSAKEGSDEKSGIVRTQKEGQPPAVSSSKESDKTPASDKRRKTDQSEAMFSPRRSSRGVIPNRRFQDMEMDFGRKRPKEEPENPDEAVARKRTKKNTVAESPRKRQVKTEKRGNEAVQQTGSQDRTVSTKVQMTAKNLSAELTAPHREASQHVPTSLSSVADVLSTHSVTSVEVTTSASSLKTGNSTISVSQPVTVTVDSRSPQVLAEKPDGTVPSETVVPEEATVVVATDDTAAQVPGKVITVAVSAPVAVSQGGLPGVTIGEASTHLTVVTSRKGEVTAVQSPGRVMAKPAPVTGGTESHRKIIIRPQPPPGAQTSGSMTSFPVSSQSRPITQGVSAEASPSKKIPLSSAQITSLIEVSPNKTVPVVIGERRENVAGNIKVIEVHPEQLASSGTSQPQQQDSNTQLSVLSTSSEDYDISESQTLEDLVDSSQESNSVKDQSESSMQASTFSSQLQTMTTAGQQGQVVIVSPKPSSAAQQTTTKQVSTLVQAAQNAEEVSSFPKVTQEISINTSDLDSSQDSDTDAADSKRTSGTQTPYHKQVSTSDGRKLITVLVQPPPSSEQQSTTTTTQRRTITYVKKEPGMDTEAVVQAEEVAESARGGMSAGNKRTASAGKQQYILVNVPEGSTVKEPYVSHTSERLEDDPSFYTVDDQGLYHCHICDYRTDRKPNFYKHKRKHLGIRPHRCDICNYRAATSSNLKRHLAIHADLRNYGCPVCGLNFRQKIHLERHIKYKHEEKKVKCPLCDYVCANENPDLKVHIRRKHVPHSGVEGAKDAFTCQECGMVAMSKRDLRQHLKFHSKGPELKLFCQMCSFVTDCESRLRRHQFIHSKEKPFQCGLCDYRGSQKEHVLRHMRSQHNIEIVRKQRAKKNASSTSSTPKSPAAASVTGSEESSASGVETPRVLERADYTSEEKIFACNHCTMKFAKLINLYKHLHTQHRDIMPSETGDFACVVCDFHTSNKKNLLVHMRKHNTTDQCPPTHVYSCVLCRYMNPRRRNLFQHMRKKHHIEIVLRDDGTTTCYVANEALTLPGASGAHGGVQLPSSSDGSIALNVVSLSDVVTTVGKTKSELQVSREDGVTVAVSSAPNIMPMKMEDLAMLVTNPHSSVSSDSCVVVDSLVPAEQVSAGIVPQSDAAEAIQGLQALAQRGVLDSHTVVEEQVMATDEQGTLVINPATLGVVEQLVQPKTEPLEVVEIDENQLLDDVNSSATISEDDTSILDGSSSVGLAGDGGDLQLSAEQLMNLATGDYIEINGEMYKVEVSNSDGAGGQQVISIEPVSDQSKLQVEREAQQFQGESS